MTIGVIGGLGPYAGLDLVRKILDHSPATQDQDHLNLIMVSLPSLVPDRTQWLLTGRGENPAKGMFECARRLHAAGADLAVVACNTAHARPIFDPYRRRVEAELPGLRLFHLIEEGLSHVLAERFERVGLLATRGTYQTGIYQSCLRAMVGGAQHGLAFSLLQPGLDGQQAIMDAIYHPDYGIKSQSNPASPEAVRLLRLELEAMREQGAQAILLGCSDLILALAGQNLGLPVIDPAEVCAKRLVHLALAQ